MVEVLLFNTAAADLALPLAAVREVLPCPLLRRAPGMPWMLAGLFTLDGRTAAVLHLAHLLGMERLPAPEERPPGLYAPLIRLRDGAGDDRLLLVDRVHDLVRAAAIRPLPAHGSFNDAVTGLVDWGGGNWHLLDAARLLLAQEQGAVAEFTRLAGARLARLEDAA